MFLINARSLIKENFVNNRLLFFLSPLLANFFCDRFFMSNQETDIEYAFQAMRSDASASYGVPTTFLSSVVAVSPTLFLSRFILVTDELVTVPG